MAAIDARHRKKVRESFARQGLMAHLGARITEVREGYVEIRTSYRIRSGKTLKVCSAEVYTHRNGSETHCATMLATIICLPGKPDRSGGS